VLCEDRAYRRAAHPGARPIARVYLRSPTARQTEWPAIGVVEVALEAEGSTVKSARCRSSAAGNRKGDAAKGLRNDRCRVPSDDSSLARAGDAAADEGRVIGRARSC